MFALLVNPHPLLALLVCTGLFIVALRPYLLRQPDGLPALGAIGTLLQRWVWWLRGTTLFSLAAPVEIALLLSLSRVLISGSLRGRQGAPRKRTLAMFLILISLFVALQLYAHDIGDPAADAFLASLLITNLSLFSGVQTREGRLWAWAYNLVGVTLAGTGTISTLAAAGFYAASFIPSLLINALTRAAQR